MPQWHQWQQNNNFLIRQWDCCCREHMQCKYQFASNAMIVLVLETAPGPLIALLLTRAADYISNLVFHVVCEMPIVAAADSVGEPCARPSRYPNQDLSWEEGHRCQVR